MGLFDGVGSSERGSTADLAAHFQWPVVLVVDARHQAASVAALVEGFVHHRGDIEIVGVIFNRVGSARHAAIVTEVTRHALPRVAVLGAVPRDPALALPERHLGLVQASEHGELNGFLDRTAAIVGSAVDLDRLVALARPARLLREAGNTATPVPPLGQRIAIARDTAFAFAYEHVLEGWRTAGAELTFFSPLSDEAPARDIDAVYLPGGYPELYAGQLAANSTFLDGVRTTAARGAAVYGECGGFMVLGRTVIDAEGQAHAMTGLLPVTTSFAERRLHLGYRELELLAATRLGPAGQHFRGHEFHYASLVDAGGAAPLFRVLDGIGNNIGNIGAIEDRVMGSFLHLIDQCRDSEARRFKSAHTR